jgi:alkanesulfonate monooxygenase SsuD/methylene tetrahydromethanopterin reductase-like flavin-dependent oxidoreductase (luciferase family)
MAALGHPEDPVDASWPRVRDRILLAEQLGFDTTLIAQHTMNPLDESLDQLDAWSAAAAKRIGSIAVRDGRIRGHRAHTARGRRAAAVTLGTPPMTGGGDTIDRFIRDTDPASVMWQRLRERPHVRPNGGTAAGLVSDYDTVAARIVDWYTGGIKTFMLAFQPFEDEMRRFAAEIMPRVRELVKRSEIAS